jgi:DNA-binding transcriptional LysR family regulator
MSNKYGIDFNLTKHLEALLNHKSVSLAAKEVGITQPAMSNSFAKIKDHFKDPILVRTKSGYVLSPFGESLLPKIKSLMDGFNSAFLEKADFDPTHDEMTFNIMVSDSAGFVFGPVFLQHMMINYPLITLNFHSMDQDLSVEKLDKGEISLSIISTLDEELPGRLYSKLLRLDPFSVAGCNKLYQDKASLSFKEYLEASHYVVAPKGIDKKVIDNALKKIGKKRNVTNKLSHFSMGISSVMHTCNLITLPSSVLEVAAKYGQVKAYQLPFEMEPMRHTMLWHERYHNDQANRWLRNILAELVKKSPGIF